MIPAIVLVYLVPHKLNWSSSFENNFFFLKIHTVPIYFEIELNQPLADTGDPVDVLTAFADHRPLPQRKDRMGAEKLLRLHHEMLELRSPRHWEC